MIVQHEYTSKPSIVTLRAALRKVAALGGDFIQLTWGKNQITMELAEHGWHGSGLIGKNGGHDLAHELELARRKETVL
tara:strand:- start:1395 stop:1628 length:234 start_codon:yes stop_codon:yes gene_type:complete